MPSPNPAPTRDATPQRRGLVSTAAQTFAGAKTFLDLVRLALRATSALPAGGGELEGSVVYDTTVKRMKLHNGTAWVPVVLSLGGDNTTSLEEHLASTSAHSAADVTLPEDVFPEWADGSQMGATSVQSALVSIVQDLANEGAGESGAERVGCGPVTQNSWRSGGELNGGQSGSVRDMFEAMVADLTDLGSIGGTYSGAERIGAKSGGSLAGTTVQAQLYELRDGKASLSGANFTGPVSTNNGGSGLAMKAGAEDCVFLTLFTRTSTPNTRSAYLGYSYAGSLNVELKNEIVNGSIELLASGTGSVGLYPGASGTVWVGGSGNLEATSRLKAPLLEGNLVVEGRTVLPSLSNGWNISGTGVWYYLGRDSRLYYYISAAQGTVGLSYPLFQLPVDRRPQIDQDKSTNRWVSGATEAMYVRFSTDGNVAVYGGGFTNGVAMPAPGFVASGSIWMGA